MTILYAQLEWSAPRLFAGERGNRLISNTIKGDLLSVTLPTLWPTRGGLKAMKRFDTLSKRSLKVASNDATLWMPTGRTVRHDAGTALPVTR